jgi:predicted amidophosphoribosyltransferase
MGESERARGDDLREEMQDVPMAQLVCPNCQAEMEEGQDRCATCGFDMAGANEKQREHEG